MDLNLLVAFDALYRERSVTRAGRALGLSQPATSAALARLRTAFDDELFVRTPRGLEPTSKCDALAEPIARALADLREAIEPHELDPATTELTFRIGAVDAVVAVLLRTLASRMMKTAKHARLSLRPCDPTNAVALLDAREIDVAIAPVTPVPLHVGSRELFAIDLVVAMRPGHPLAKRGSVDVDALVAYPHALVNFAGPLRTAVDDALAGLGKARHVAVALSSFLAVPHVLAESDAVAVVPGPFGRKLAADGVLACRPLPPELPQPDVRMKMLWPARADRSPASVWLRGMIVDTLEAALPKAPKIARRARP